MPHTFSISDSIITVSLNRSTLDMLRACVCGEDMLWAEKPGKINTQSEELQQACSENAGCSQKFDYFHRVHGTENPAPLQTPMYLRCFKYQAHGTYRQDPAGDFTPLLPQASKLQVGLSPQDASGK